MPAHHLTPSSRSRLSLRSPLTPHTLPARTGGPRRRSVAASCAALLLACAATARGDMFYWAAQGNTNLFSEEQMRAVAPFEFRPLTGNFDIMGGGLVTEVLPNLFRPTQPGGVNGSIAEGSYYFELVASGNNSPPHHLVFANALHANRTAVLDAFVDVRSTQVTTRGDIHLSGVVNTGTSLRCRDWFMRWPAATGTLTISTQLLTDAMWLGGSGEVVVRDYLKPNTWQGSVTKSGNAVLVIDPDPSAIANSPPVEWPLNIRRGPLILRGTAGVRLFTTNAHLSLGTEFGGQDTIPTDIPYPGWEAIDLGSQTAPPVVHVRRSDVMFSQSQLRLGAIGSAVFDAPMPITFAGSIVSHAPLNGLVVQGGAFTASTTFTDNVLDGFTGRIRIDAGTLRTPVPNTLSTIVFNSSRNSDDAVLEIQVFSGTTSLQNSYSGLGRLAKSGAGTLNLVNAAPSFTGDYRVIEGTLGTSTTPDRTVLSNDVLVSGGTLLSRAAENIDDDATIRLSGGVWNLGGFTETVSGLLIQGGSAASLSGGTLRLAGNLIALPGPASTSRVNGPGTLHFTGSAERTIDVGASTAPVGLDIAAAVSGAPIVVTGQGVVQFAGGFQSPSLTVRTGTARLSMPPSAAKPASVTVGFVDPFNPDAPAARLELGASDQLAAGAGVGGAGVSLSNRAIVDLNGFVDTIGGLTVSGAGPFTIQTGGTGELGLAGPASFSGPGTTTISGALNLLAGSRDWTINSGSAVNLGGIAYSGTLNKLGPGALRLDGLEGYFTLNNSGFATSVGTASLGGLSGSGSLRVDTALTVGPIAGVQTAYSGAITGAGSLIKSGPGRLELNAGATNTYTGGTRVEGGTLFLNRLAGTTVIPGNVTVASGGTLLYAGGASNQIADAADVIVDAGGAVRMDGQSETVSDVAVSGEWSVDRSDGTPGNLRVNGSAFVLGGTLSGTMSGGQLSLLNEGVADIRGTVASVNVGANGRLAVGGKVGSDQLTITGNFTMFNSTSRVTFTPGAPTDPALIRALGTLTYPASGQVQVRVNQNAPQQAGTVIRLIDFGTGTSVPQLSRYALIAPLAGSGRGRLTLEGRVLSYVVVQNPCPADADGSGTLTIDDIFFFLNLWFAGGVGSDFDLSGTQSIDDIFIFLNAWFAGC